MRPPPIAFSVPLKLVSTATGEALPPRWLGPDGTAVDIEARAVVFSMHRSPTPRDTLRIDQRAHALAGGLRPFLELQRGARSARAATIAALEQELWPQGRPERVDDKQGRAADETKLEAAWRDTDLIEKAGFIEMQAMLDRLEFLARWTSLIVDPPPGWEDIAEREMPEPQLYAIMYARSEAMAEATLGKPPPSAS